MRCVFSEGGRQIRLGQEGPETLHGAVRAQGSGVLGSGVLGKLKFGVVRTLAADLLHAILPSDCRICAGPMLGLSPVRVCSACIERLHRLSQSPDELCRRCGAALGMESARFAAAMGMHECTACRTVPPAFTRAVAFAAYDSEMRELLHALKFGGARRVAGHVLGGCLAEAIVRLEPETQAGLIVVPVPLFRNRQKSRGYNQAELLARAAVRRVHRLRPGWKLELHTGVLRRVRDTKAMFQLGPEQRRRNLSGAFAVGNAIGEAQAVRGRDILLIDDILTTGATANGCAKVLLEAGASAVWVATVARAQPESTLVAAEDVARWDAAPAASFAATSFPATSFPASGPASGLPAAAVIGPD